MELVKWKVDFDRMMGRVSIKEDTYNQLPIAQVLTPVGDWMNNPLWVKAALDKANKIAAIPVMIHALEVALFAIDVEDQAYLVVQEAITLAKGGKQ